MTFVGIGSLQRISGNGSTVTLKCQTAGKLLEIIDKMQGKRRNDVAFDELSTLV